MSNLAECPIISPMPRQTLKWGDYNEIIVYVKNTAAFKCSVIGPWIGLAHSRDGNKIRIYGEIPLKEDSADKRDNGMIEVKAFNEAGEDNIEVHFDII